ncbi:MAG: TlpA family protein disulfide reductase [Sphingobacteriales bacterium]|nr:TlpA family protein disulfide reductase [Sphingobacteriales bacterium]
MRKIFSIVLLFISLFITGCKNADEKHPASGESTGITLDKVKLTGLNGQRIDLSQYNGKTVFVNFWATWCTPCIGEMPSLQQMTEKLKEKKIVFLFASDETTDEIEGFKNTKNYSLDFVRAENFSDLNIMGLPTTFIFDKNGKLAFSEMGAREWDSEESISLITKINNQQ